jgi:hypothetical protein
MPSQPLKNQTTSNLWKHLKKMHPSVHAEYEKISSIRRSSTPSASAFFQPRQAPSNVPSNAPSSSKYRDDYSITPAIFTVTRDNGSTNTTMQLESEKLASTNPISLKQPWAFTAKAGDVRCIGHIINIAVQAALASLKATPDERVEAYRLEIGAARIPLVAENDIVTVLAKLRRHIYVFRNRRGWKDALKNQCKAASIKVRQLTLDM